MERESASRTLRIEFLQMEGCPHAPSMLQSLHGAIGSLNLRVDLRLLDIEELSLACDNRSGYGSPTILVEGRDLFGAHVPAASACACRIYAPGVPEAGVIAAALEPTATRIVLHKG
jgi:hypothetical protein